MKKEQRCVLKNFYMFKRFNNVFHFIDFMYETKIFFTKFRNENFELHVDKFIDTSKIKICDLKNELTINAK